MDFTKMAKAILIASVVTLTASQGWAVEYFLRADTTTVTLPDGQVVTMWGFAQDTAFGALDGTVTIPGPLLTVPEGDANLTLHLDNNLAVPVSITINGQTATMTPVRNADGRVVSFTHETAPGNAAPVDYVWTNFQPGTYIYQSGSHVAVQIQMGLYGGVTKDFDAGEAYSGVTYDVGVPVFFSEIDPALHHAVATNNYGPGLAMTSTIDYAPKYYLINGQPYVFGQGILPAGDPGDTVLLRFFNMGLKTRCPLLQGGFMTLVAEDGQPYQFSREQYVALLPAGKTIDALITSPAATVYPLYDRRLGLTSAETTGSGMLSYIVIGADSLVPVVNSVTATPSAIVDTQTSQLLADADNGTVLPLSYNWIVPLGAGSVSDPTIANPVYLPPDVPVGSSQTFTLTVEVSDGLSTVSDTVDVTVVDPVIFSAPFTSGRGGFSYLDDAFNGTNAPAYASGARIASGGFTGGALQVSLGGIDNTSVQGMSGGWQRTLNAPMAGNVNISFRYKVTQSPHYENNEISRLRLSMDGVIIATGAQSVIRGDGNGGPEITTGWRLFEGTVPLAAGNHTIIIGGFNNRKNASNEQTTILIDNVLVSWN